MTTITSVANSHIKQIVRLKEGRARRQEKKFLIDGVRECSRAWRSGFSFEEVFVPFLEKPGDFVSNEHRHQEELRDFLRELRQNRLPIHDVSLAVFDKIAFGDRNEGILAVVASQDRTFDDLESVLPESPLIGVIERIEKPGNVGAVFRSADGAGLDALVLADPLSDLYNPNTIRASLGTLFHLPTVIASSEATVEWLVKKRVQIVAALCDSAGSYASVDYTLPTAIVLGNEADGLTPLWAELAAKSLSSRSPIRGNESKVCGVKIPMLGIADSLNISNAAAILFYEAQRQRSL